MGAAPLLVYYTGRGKKPGTYNFEFKDKKGNHDLSRRDVKEYIKYKEGSAPGPFGYNSGLNKFKQESKQFSLAQTAKKILKESDNDSRSFEDNCEILQKFESEDKLYSKEAREILQDADELTEDELNDAVNDLMKQYRLSDPRINKKTTSRRPNPWDSDYRDGDYS
jgi:hypothetical protein